MQGSTIFLYLCLGYFIFHLLLSDILVLYNFFIKKDDNLTCIESKIITTMCNKICDTVLKCVMGYFYVFNSCWLASIDCLKQIILAYIVFLDKVFSKILNYPICISTTLIVVILTITTT